MAFTKKFSEIPILENPTGSEPLIALNGSQLSRLPQSAISGGSKEPFIIDPDSDEFDPSDTYYGDQVLQAYMDGREIWAITQVYAGCSYLPCYSRAISIGAGDPVNGTSTTAAKSKLNVFFCGDRTAIVSFVLTTSKDVQYELFGH